MLYSYDVLFIQGFISLLLSYSFTNAAIILSNLSALSDVSPSIHRLNYNSSTTLNGTTRCVLPVLPLAPVNIEACQPTFQWLLRAQDADIPRLYLPGTTPITITHSAGCAISLDKRGLRGGLSISKRMIVDYARQVLLLCEDFGQGGWMHVDGNEDWIVIVSGRRETGVLADKTAAVSGSMVIDLEKQ